MSVVYGIKKQYAPFNLDIPELELKETGITGLVGPSGSGKTSILKILSGLVSCPSLKWIWDGVDIAQLPIESRKIGFVFQTLELFPHMTALQNIQFATHKKNKDIDFLISTLQIKNCLNTLATSLSQGEKQRVALARALSIQPRILFLDEPFSSLDEENKSNAKALIEHVIGHYKIPALLISHDKEDILSLSHSVVHIENGSLNQIESISNV